MSNYKQTFGIRSRHKRNKAIKSEKGEPGFGFKLTNDNNYDMETKRLTNVGGPKEDKDALTKGYFIERTDQILRNFLGKNEDIDMNNKTIKNISWPNNINDAVPKKYLYQNVLLFDNKINSFNAKDNRIKNVGDPIEDGDAVNKKHLNQIINPQVSEPFLPPNSVDWVRFFELQLNLIHTIDSRIFILKGTVKIKQDVSSKSNWIGNVPLIEKSTSPIVLFVWHFEDNKTYDFLQDDPKTLSRRSIIDQDNKLTVYGNLKGSSTLYFNILICI
jgi:hypothetical protein